jgi:hypothetical protein
MSILTAKDLKNKLLALLENELGQYANQQPSIWIYGASSNPPTRSDGLECLILEQPSSPAQSASGGIKYKPQTFQVILKNYIQSSRLLNAIRIIETNFVVKNYSYMPSTNDILEQCNLEVFIPIVYGV